MTKITVMRAAAYRFEPGSGRKLAGGGMRALTRRISREWEHLLACAAAFLEHAPGDPPAARSHATEYGLALVRAAKSKRLGLEEVDLVLADAEAWLHPQRSLAQLQASLGEQLATYAQFSGLSLEVRRALRAAASGLARRGA